jgi:ElaA protein
MNILVISFAEFSIQQLYDVLQLRSQVFVVEQDCVYQDIDGKDERALHLLGYVNGVLAGYTRIFKAGDYFKQSSIGRVVVHPNYRGLSYGKKLMVASIDTLKKQQTAVIKISAQCYLDKFYKNLGFVATGNNYLEDGIPHQEMLLEI